jgi:hypothetical protein
MGATIVFVAVTAGASGAAPTDFRLVLDGKHNAALLHEGTFTTSASFCTSGAAEDISVDGSTDTAQRRFRCGDAGGHLHRRRPFSGTPSGRRAAGD